MADLELTVVIEDINVSQAAQAFLRYYPMTKDEETGEDKFTGTKPLVEDFLKIQLLKAINNGVDLLAKDVSTKLTKAIFKE